jgi:drug/metabolite transporter (DMT)-like permease
LNFIPIVLGLVLTLSYGTSDFLSKGVTTQIGPYRTTIYILVVSGIGALIPGLFIGSSFAVSPFLALVLVVVAVTSFLAFAFIYRAYDRGMLSLTAPIVNSYPALSVVFSVLFLGVVFSAGVIISLIVVMIGSVLVSTNLSDLRKMLSSRRRILSPGVGSAFLAALSFAVCWTAFGFATEKLGYLLPAIAIRGAAALVGLAAAPLLGEKVRPVPGTWLRGLLAMSLLELIGVIVFNLGVTLSGSAGSIPILTVFGAMGSAITVVLAVAFLRERLELNHLIGIVLLIAGVVALLYLTS